MGTPRSSRKNDIRLPKITAPGVSAENDGWTPRVVIQKKSPGVEPGTPPACQRSTSTESGLVNHVHYLPPILLSGNKVDIQGKRSLSHNNIDRSISCESRVPDTWLGGSSVSKDPNEFAKSPQRVQHLLKEAKLVHSASEPSLSRSLNLKNANRWGNQTPDPDMDLDLYGSLALPRIDSILRSEGIENDTVYKKMKESSKYVRPSEANNEKTSFTLYSNYSQYPKMTLSPCHVPDNVIITPRTKFKKLEIKTDRQQDLGNLRVESENTPGLSSPRNTDTQENQENHKLGSPYDIYNQEIENTKWLSEKQIEKSLMGNTNSPRVVLIASNLPDCSELMYAVKPDKDILAICYDFQSPSYSSIIEEISRELKAYKPGSKAKSILLYCKGSPGCIYILKKKIVTPQKLKRQDQEDLREFWIELSNHVSKLSPENSDVYIMGCFDLKENQQGDQLLDELTELTKPNKINFQSHAEQSDRGQEVLKEIFDEEQYNAWKQRT